jgi:large subunit ribosomal protein L16
MKQFPSNLKFKKYHKVNYSFSYLIEKKVFFPIYGEYAIQSVDSGKLTFKQIESCRRTLRRGLKKKSKLWIRCFTNAPVTQKPIASRMGKGKGNISH